MRPADTEAEVERFRLMAARAVEREAGLLQRAGVVPGARILGPCWWSWPGSLERKARWWAVEPDPHGT